MMLGMDREKYEQWYSVKGMFGLIIFYVYFVARIYGSLQYYDVKEATYSTTQITFKDNKFEATDTLIYIGKTNGFVFMYNRTKKLTDAIPMSDVSKIEVTK